MSKIHYVKQGEISPVCNRSGWYSETTTDISRCTCNACIRTLSGVKAGGIPKREDGRNKVGIVLSDKAFAKFQAIPKGKRSKLINDFIEALGENNH